MQVEGHVRRFLDELQLQYLVSINNNEIILSPLNLKLNDVELV